VLDFSSPQVAGAFVFDPSGSVDSIDVARARLTEAIVTVSMPSRDSALPLQPPHGKIRFRMPSNGEIPVQRPRRVNHLPRATTTAPLSSSEDPH